MATYQINGNKGTLTTTLSGTAAIWSGATTLRRLKIYEFDIGATAAPVTSDCNITIDLSRMTYTSLIVGTAYTPNPTDPADGPAAAVSNINISTELVAGNISSATPEYNNGMNQRNTIRWVAAQESQYLISPATAFNGHYMRASSPSYNASLQANVYYLE